MSADVGEVDARAAGPGDLGGDLLLTRLGRVEPARDEEKMLDGRFGVAHVGMAGTSGKKPTEAL